MLEIAARLHAFLHGLFRPTDEAETRMLFDKVERLFVRTKLDEPRGRELLIETLTEHVLDSFGCRADHPQRAVVSSFISQIFDGIYIGVGVLLFLLDGKWVFLWLIVIEFCLNSS